MTHGAVDAIERILTAHLTRGDAVAVEDPCFLSSIGAVRLNGFRSVPVPVDAAGMTVDGLQAALASGARAVVCTPRAHNPTGASLTVERAEALRAVLAGFPQVLVIEDDHFSAIAVTPYQRITPDSTTRWALVRSVSKFLGPDLRVALVAADSDTTQRLEARLSSAAWVSHLLQHLVATLLIDPGASRRMRDTAETYTRRRRTLTDALTARAIDHLPPSDGLNVWIPLPGNEQLVVDALTAAGWLTRPGAVFTLTGQPGIRVTTASMTARTAERFSASLATVLHETQL